MSTATISFPATRQAPRRPAAADRRQATRSDAVGAVRLTRRGRLVVLFTVTAAAFGGFTLISGPAASTHTDHHPTSRTVVVEPGQTLWDIAKVVAPGADPRTVIAEIVDLNGLPSAGDIRAGEPLFVPSS